MAKFVAAAAIDRGLPGAVALEARAHTGGDLFLKDFAFGNRAVTGLAFHGGPGVNRMAEEDKIRQAIDPHPRNRLLPGGELSQLANRGNILIDRGVADHALVCLRNAGPLLALGLRVAILAFDTGGRVPPMTEGNRLRRYGKGKLLLNSLICGLLGQ